MTTTLPTFHSLRARTALAAAGLALAAALPAQVVLDESFTGGASTTGFTIESADTSACDWLYAPGGLTELSFSLDGTGALPTGAGFDGDFAFLDADACAVSGDSVSSYLVSAAFDASGAGTYRLAFSQQFRALGDSYGKIEVYNGSAWTEVYTIIANAGYPNPAVYQEVDITAAAGGSAAAQVRFHFASNWDWWWAVDAITVTRLSCTAPTATASLVEDCDNGQFSISVDVTDLGDATSVEIFGNGVSFGSITGPQTQLAGPFASQTMVGITVAHTDALCDLMLDSLTYNCGPCLNTVLFPNDTFAVDVTGDTLEINANMYAGAEYNALSGLVSGEVYEFTHSNGSYITVREGTYDGPVVGEGYSPLQVTIVTSGDHFVHYTVDEQCNTDATGSFATTVQLLIDAGVDELAASGLRIFPNPTNGVLFVDYRSNTPVNIRVYDMVGHVVLEENMTNRVDVSSLKLGAYVLTTLDAQGTVLARARFSKQ